MAAGSSVSSGADRPRPAPGPAVPLVGGGRLPLAFIGLGIACLAGGGAWLALHPALLTLPHLHPRVAGLAHAWLPGFLLSACMGAVYQLAPVVLGTPLRGGRLAWAHLGLHAGGLALLVAGLARGRFEFAAGGGTLISAGVLVLAQAIGRTFAASRRRDAIAWCFPLATGWLVLTVLAGVALALARIWPIAGFSPLPWLRAHAHLGIVGFFVTLLQGATFQLVPMFTMGEPRRPRCVSGGLAATQGGLAVLAAGLALEVSSVTAIGGLAIATGIALSAIAFVSTLRSRRRRELEPVLQGFVAGVGLLATVAVVGLGLLALPAGSAALRGAFAYGAIVVAGGLSLAVLGMLGKIIPFLVWMRAYGPRVGRQPVPTATTLSHRSLERAWLALHLAALPLLVVAIAAGSRAAAAAGALVLAMGLAAFLLNAARILLHLRQSPRPIEVRPQPVPAT